ncbi:site-specific DNA-methyltransferase [Roseovarius sp. D0-M9]|uniref:site-specific DNA-methyltransferase n=1 Tax=Roseovarius sp. D0-M9 TaxID=3127117 RepID=UPI00301052C9
MSDEIEKLKMHSPDLTAQNVERIAALFPGCVTESTGADGTLCRAIDFDLLRQELSDSIVEGPQERYHLDWPGKRQALITANAPIAKTLRPVREESVGFDTTRNLFIEGDNLEALKLLQETYLGKVKMIYIDPPYNTGKDFIYKDDFAERSQDFLVRSNQIDDQGARLVSNSEANGRMHSDWLSFIYGRLKLSKNLLRADGIIFVSINHKEIANLKRVMDEVFGEDNMLCQFSWRTDGNFDNQAKFKYCHEYILAFAKNELDFPAPTIVDPNTPEGSKIFRPEIRNTIVKNGPKNPIGRVHIPRGFPASFDQGVIPARSASWPHLLEDVIVANGFVSGPVDVESGWSSKELLEDFIENDFEEISDAKGQLTRFEITRTGAIEAVKVRGEPSHVISVLNGLGGPQRATLELDEIEVIFDDYPKPTGLIEYFLRMNRGDDFIALDFFAGSATTAHSVLKLNAQEGRCIQFIMVQLPECCRQDSKAFKAGFSTIAEISKERIRRAGAKILEGECHSDWNRDVGFRVLKIDSSNMADVYYTPDATTQADLLIRVDNIKPDRTAEDLLFQVLLDWGVDLTLPITRESVDGKTVFTVAGTALIACFDNGVDETLVKTLATRKPLRVVFKDTGFKDDATKINVKQIFKSLSPDTDVKAV